MNMFSSEQSFRHQEFIREYSENVVADIMNESGQVAVADAILDKMFQLTIFKYNKINFNDIETTRGDITRFKYYKELNGCIEKLMDIHKKANNLPSVVTIYTTLHNIKDMKNIFQYNFRIKNNCAIMIYNTMVYILMEAVSYTLAASIYFVNENNVSVLKVNPTKSDMLIDILNKFNVMIADGSIMRFIDKASEANTMNEASIYDLGNIVKDFIINNKKTIATAGIIAAVLMTAINIIPLLREAVYWIFKVKHNISEAARVQSEFFKLNIEKLSREDGTEVIVSKQEKYVKFFDSISKTFAIDGDKATRDTKHEIQTSKINVSNVVV